MSWPVVTLKEVTKLVTCGVAKRPEYVDEGVPFLSAKNVKHGEIIYEGYNCISQETHDALTKHNKPEIGDILYTRVGSVGEAAIIEKDIEFSVFVSLTLIKPKHELIDNQYLKYLLNSEPFKARALGNLTGIGVGNLNVSVVREYPIPLPPLEEQKRIAAILDKADSVRRKRQQAIDLADDFLRSVFLDMFGDPVTNPRNYPVSKLGTNCDDLFLGLTSKVDYVDGIDGYPLIRAKDINKGELSFEEVKYISETQHKKLTKNHLTRKGDLLVSKSGTLGTCAIVRTDREFSTYESIFTVRPNTSKVNIHYLIHLLQNRSFKQKLIGNKVGGTVAHLNLKMFRDFEIGLPPIDVQNDFSMKIQKSEQKLAKYKQSALEANSFFNSLSQKAFAGEL